MPYKIRIGILEDLEYPPHEDLAAMLSCISYTEGEIIRKGKPFLGLHIGDRDPIMYWQFDDAIKFIDKYIKKGDVQVVCEGGSSRSVAVALAYYLSTGMKYDDAIKKLGMGVPKCWIHRRSLVDWTHEKGFMDEEDFQKEESKLATRFK